MRRRILDQLHQLVLEHDLARRGRDVPADLEGLVVAHADLQAPLAALEVAEQVLEPVQQVLPAGLLGLAQHGGIGHDEVRGRHRADELAGEEIDLLLLAPLEPRHVLDQPAQPARRQQIGLLHVVEDQVLAPRLILEPPVAAVGLDHRRGCLAQHALHGALPQRHAVLPELDLRLGEARGIAHQPGAERHEGAADRARVRDRKLIAPLGRGLALPERLDHALAAFGELGETLGGRSGVGC